MAAEIASRVVVGVDGSEHGDVALRYALQEATRRGAQVLVLSVWDPPIQSLSEYYGIEHYDKTKWDAVHERTIREHVDEIVAQEPGATSLVIEVRARTGRPAAVLVEAARGADLLVLGHRGHGGLPGAALGSVGLSCVQHAPCPVLVVPSSAAH